MRNAFLITTCVIGAVIAYGYPFVAVLRHKPAFRVVGISWGLLFLYFLALSLIFPLVVSAFNEDFAKELWRSWVPEMPGIAAAAIAGWVPASMAVLAGIVIKFLLKHFRKGSSKHPQNIDTKDDHAT